MVEPNHINELDHKLNRLAYEIETGIQRGLSVDKEDVAIEILDIGREALGALRNLEQRLNLPTEEEKNEHNT